MEQWSEAEIIDIKFDMVKVHYNGWSRRWDEWISFNRQNFNNSPRIDFFRSHTIQSGYSLYLSPTPQTVLDGEFDKYCAFLRKAYPELKEEAFEIDSLDKKDIFSKKEITKIGVIKKKCGMIKQVSKLIRNLADSLEKIADLTLNRINIELELRLGRNELSKKEQNFYKKEKKKSFSNENKIYKKKNLEIINEGK